ncbi:hypothetical protein B9G98_03961 [Wickerhamiella sorbophila]|uniref:Uncharacterized protein n=1 Tax=Wickerhamiella sorbophila TaxID=45607 RepID=A0A2T0FMX9_9ASCO|nr:hypothetical protein B9G98_03961 [Wickerhamiella sorbophila]PRT56341.1 hypothetical protein B9G98_03961 [Wickerhamiella sorbophila]
MFSSLASWTIASFQKDISARKHLSQRSKISDNAEESLIEDLKRSVRSTGSETLKPPGVFKTLQQLTEDAVTEQSYDSAGLNDQGFLAEVSNEADADRSISLLHADSSQGEFALNTSNHRSPPSFVFSPVTQAETSTFERFGSAGNDSWNTTYTEDDTYNDMEYVRQGFMPSNEPNAFITPRRISSRTY